MITIISGVPGSGKTALIVDMLMDEVKAGRRIYTIGIPDLLLKVERGGDPYTWHEGTWLEIDHYDPKLTKLKGIQGEWFPRNCAANCPWLSTCSHKFGTYRDSGALVVIDEAHITFPQRSSGKEPPAYVQALSVHRQAGLDIWFISQRPSFLDPFVRGLCSRHIHIGLSLVSLFGERVKYEWPEYQENVNRVAKTLAAKNRYKPGAHVFPLYKSATVHTKLDQRLPSVVKLLLFLVVVFVVFVFYLFQRAQSRYVELIKPASANQGFSVSEKPVSRAVVAASSVAASGVVPSALADLLQAAKREPLLISACMANATKCQCYTHQGVKVKLSDAECREAALFVSEKFRLEVPQQLSFR